MHTFGWTKIWTLIKTKWNRKWKIPHLVLERRTLCFSSYKNGKLKVNLWWVGARERKKKAFFVPFILSEGNFFNIHVLVQCIMYWTHFQNMHTFTKKHFFMQFYCLFLKSSKAFSVSLIENCFTEMKPPLLLPAISEYVFSKAFHFLLYFHQPNMLEHPKWIMPLLLEKS